MSIDRNFIELTADVRAMLLESTQQQLEQQQSCTPSTSVLALRGVNHRTGQIPVLWARSFGADIPA